MNKLKNWWKRAKCLLTGGCKYEASELRFVYTPSHGFTEARYDIYNECVKCGKSFRGEIPAKTVEKMIMWSLIHEKNRWKAKEKNDGK